MGQTGITVVGQKRDLMIPVQKPGHLKHMRGGKGAFRKMRHFLPVHQKPQASGPLRFQKDALPRLGNKRNAPGQPRFSLKGIFSGKTGGDGRVFIKSILRVSKRRVRVPLVLPQILMPDSVFIQSAGKPHGINLPVSDIGLPEAGYVIVHLSLLSAARRIKTRLPKQPASTDLTVYHRGKTFAIPAACSFIEKICCRDARAFDRLTERETPACLINPAFFTDPIPENAVLNRTFIRLYNPDSTARQGKAQ